MGYKNSNVYVARQMDIILDAIDAAKTYCDDLVVSDSSLDEHIANLRQVLRRLRQFNISMGPDKSFVGFPNWDVGDARLVVYSERGVSLGHHALLRV
ncbi:uncharacterized protein SPSK_10124 [Sporothrix schenckii 1099-18]|uniref:Reverse transcriptase domain-containing protein n=1 Tax=Sporothrix schenckii 1099-18 TaxID=1397361 RepID=A0A0F2M7F6_SPOSC|nr:uncharacterized protein SPSK_10124 [Sporothrix schenckii 1099-18]KJR84999.1 hypothetical protein SPSK_10124 [Sporothrix schenckii 1099-18]